MKGIIYFAGILLFCSFICDVKAESTVFSASPFSCNTNYTFCDDFEDSSVNNALWGKNDKGVREKNGYMSLKATEGNEQQFMKSAPLFNNSNKTMEIKFSGSNSISSVNIGLTDILHINDTLPYRFLAGLVHNTQDYIEVSDDRFKLYTYGSVDNMTIFTLRVEIYDNNTANYTLYLNDTLANTTFHSASYYDDYDYRLIWYVYTDAGNYAGRLYYVLVWNGTSADAPYLSSPLGVLYNESLINESIIDKIYNNNITVNYRFLDYYNIEAINNIFDSLQNISESYMNDSIMDKIKDIKSELDNSINNNISVVIRNFSSMPNLSMAQINESGLIKDWSQNISSGVFNGMNYVGFYGSSLTGSSGSVYRNYTIAQIDIASVDNFILHPNVSYNVSGGLMTFYNPIWNDEYITLYWSGNQVKYLNFLGSGTTGSDGDINRNLTLSINVSFVAVDNYMLNPTIDFTVISGGIQFKNKLWDDEVITIWSR